MRFQLRLIVLLWAKFLWPSLVVRSLLCSSHFWLIDHYFSLPTGKKYWHSFNYHLIMLGVFVWLTLSEYCVTNVPEQRAISRDSSTFSSLSLSWNNLVAPVSFNPTLDSSSALFVAWFFSIDSFISSAIRLSLSAAAEFVVEAETLFRMVKLK